MTRRKLTSDVTLAVLVLTLPAGTLRADSEELEVQTVVVRLLDQAHVPAQEAGVLMKLNVREGTEVTRGELLGQIDDRISRLAERTADLELQAAKAKAENDVSLRYAAKAHEVARAELTRSSNSVRTFAGSVSQSQLDVERLTVEKTALEQEQAEHERMLQRFDVQLKDQALAAARLQINRRRIVSPLDGTIAELYVRRGEWVEPGQKVLRIVSTRKLKAEGFIPADQAPRDLQGTAVRLVTSATSADTSGMTLQGTITFVNPEMDPITGQVRIWAEIDNREQYLRPGQRVRMWIASE